jgi:hypothetical protein
MAKRKRKKGQTMTCKALHRKLDIERYGKEHKCMLCSKTCGTGFTSYNDNGGNTFNIQGSIICKAVCVI